ncbi:MAG: hypothetical protein HC828_06490 [Blastochloris sp.]|nr:hypothetical protein [Blastochloris sp.]
MPSPLETLVKILKLEREQGYKNTAVIRGLSNFSQVWSKEAHAHARKPEHHVLVDELHDLLGRYDDMASKEERHASVTYMIDRITGRAPMPDSYAARLSLYPTAAPPTEREPRPPDEQRREPRPRQERERRDQPEQQPEGDRSNRRDDRRERGNRNRGEDAARGEQGERGGEGGPPFMNSEDVPTPIEGPRRELPAPDPGYAAPEPPHAGKPADAKQSNKKRDKQKNRQPQGQAEPTRTPAAVTAPRVDAHSEGGSFDADFINVPNTPAELDIPLPVRLARPPRRPRPHTDREAAADILRGLNAPVEKMKGVGPKMASLLEKVGIESINDLLFYLPRRYDDYTQLLPIARAREPGMSRHRDRHGRTRDVIVFRKGATRKDFRVILSDGSARLGITFFGQFYLSRQLRPGLQIVVRGTTNIFNGRVEMSNPEWEVLDVDNLRQVAIVPVYRLTGGPATKGAARTAAACARLLGGTHPGLHPRKHAGTRRPRRPRLGAASPALSRRVGSPAICEGSLHLRPTADAATDHARQPQSVAVRPCNAYPGERCVPEQFLRQRVPV